MERRRLGRTGMIASVLGFGGSEIGYDRVAVRTVERLLGSALDAGLNVIDTAECYADGETLTGQAVGARRRQFSLVPKCAHPRGRVGPVRHAADVDQHRRPGGDRPDASPGTRAEDGRHRQAPTGQRRLALSTPTGVILRGLLGAPAAPRLSVRARHAGERGRDRPALHAERAGRSHRHRRDGEAGAMARERGAARRRSAAAPRARRDQCPVAREGRPVVGGPGLIARAQCPAWTYVVVAGPIPWIWSTASSSLAPS